MTKPSVRHSGPLCSTWTLDSTSYWEFWRAAEMRQSTYKLANQKGKFPQHVCSCTFPALQVSGGGSIVESREVKSVTFTDRLQISSRDNYLLLGIFGYPTTMIPFRGLMATFLLCTLPFLLGKPISYEEKFHKCRTDTFNMWNCLADIAVKRLALSWLLQSFLVW